MKLFCESKDRTMKRIRDILTNFMSFIFKGEAFFMNLRASTERFHKSKQKLPKWQKNTLKSNNRQKNTFNR